VPDASAAGLAWDDFKDNNRSFILDLFWGQHKSTLRCANCGGTAVRWETFSHLSVPMPSSSSSCSLRECLRLYLAEGTIQDWRCSHCDSSTEATKTLDLWHLPPILIVHLQRFYNDGAWRKNKCYVDFPIDDLELSPLIANQQARHLRDRYQLYSVINHYGSMEEGHYTAFCRGVDTVRWHGYNDDDVHQISRGAVQSEAGYVLFYFRSKS